MRRVNGRSDEEQLVLYARDLRHLVEIERAQRLLESAYKETVSALASALGTKDTVVVGGRLAVEIGYGSRIHAQPTIDRLMAALQAALGALVGDEGGAGLPDSVLAVLGVDERMVEAVLPLSSLRRACGSMP